MSRGITSIAVVGSGAIGLYYGGRLAAVGEDVRFLARTDYEVLSRDGLRVESAHGNFQVPDIQVFRSSGEIGPVDLVIVAWKTTANDHLVSVLPPLLHAETRVLTLQNGLGNCELLADIVGPERVLGGLCFVCINRITPGLVSHTAGGKMTLGQWQNGDGEFLRELESRFIRAGIHAVAVENLRKSQWEKLVWNIPFNGLSVAEGGVTTDVLLECRRTEDEMRSLMAEVVTAARALGLPLEDGLIDSNIERTRPMGPYRTSSMIDFVEGREVEVAPIWEEPLRQATAAGVPMSRLTDLLRRIREQIDLRITR